MRVKLNSLSKALTSWYGKLMTFAFICVASISQLACSTLWEVSETASSNMFDHFATLYNHWAWLVFIASFVVFLISNKQSPVAKWSGGICIGIIIGYIAVNAGQQIFGGTMDSLVEDFGGSTTTN